jgi:hypothetical protein
MTNGKFQMENEKCFLFILHPSSFILHPFRVASRKNLNEMGIVASRKNLNEILRGILPAV